MNMKAAFLILLAGVMLLLGEFSPAPHGFPYYVLAVVLAAMGLWKLAMGRQCKPHGSVNPEKWRPSGASLPPPPSKKCSAERTNPND